MISDFGFRIGLPHLPFRAVAQVGISQMDADQGVESSLAKAQSRKVNLPLILLMDVDQGVESSLAQVCLPELV